MRLIILLLGYHALIAFGNYDMESNGIWIIPLFAYAIILDIQNAKKTSK